ncbi:MAG: hypothetical protein H6672_00355 [Anaerolineaceae bacterium]|nr:hypothetical protein [Anaerolineaceae bacterium]
MKYPFHYTHPEARYATRKRQSDVAFVAMAAYRYYLDTGNIPHSADVLNLDGHVIPDLHVIFTELVKPQTQVNFAALYGTGASAAGD